MPPLGRIDDTAREEVHYESTYSVFTHDHCNDIHKNLPVAGVPTIRIDKEDPVQPPRTIITELENLGNESTVASLMFPSILTTYGVSHRDYFLGRTAPEIRSIFENIGVEFPDNSFDIIFHESAKADCFPGDIRKCCIETFRNNLHKLAYEYYLATM